jgi:hypothetical protein
MLQNVHSTTKIDGNIVHTSLQYPVIVAASMIFIKAKTGSKTIKSNTTIDAVC